MAEFEEQRDPTHNPSELYPEAQELGVAAVPGQVEDLPDDSIVAATDCYHPNPADADSEIPQPPESIEPHLEHQAVASPTEVSLTSPEIVNNSALVIDFHRFDDEPFDSETGTRVMAVEHVSMVEEVLAKYDDYAHTHPVPVEEGEAVQERRLLYLEARIGETRVLMDVMKYRIADDEAGVYIPGAYAAHTDIRYRQTDGTLVQHRFRPSFEDQQLHREDVDLSLLIKDMSPAHEVGIEGQHRQFFDAFAEQQPWLAYESSLGLNNLPVGPHQMRYISELLASAVPRVKSLDSIWIHATDIETYHMPPIDPLASADAAISFTRHITETFGSADSEPFTFSNVEQGKGVDLRVGWETDILGQDSPAVDISMTTPINLSPRLMRHATGPEDVVVRTIKCKVVENELILERSAHIRTQDGDMVRFYATAQRRVGEQMLSHILRAIREPRF